MVLLAFIMVLQLAACSGTKQVPQSGDVSKQQPTGSSQVKEDNKQSASGNSQEIAKIKFWRIGTEKNKDDYYKGFIERFEAKYPNIKVDEYLGVPTDSFDTKLNSAFASGTQPDVFCFPINQIAQRAELKQFAQLDEFINKWSDKSDVIDNLFKIGSYKGNVYALPLYLDIKIFAWRKDYFKDAGLDPEKPPKTWEELKDYSRKLTKRDGDKVVRAGFDVPTQNGELYMRMFYKQNGGDSVDESNGELRYEMPETVEALDFLASFKKENLTIPYDFYKYSDTPFMYGNAAMTYCGPAELNGLIKNNPDLKDKIGVSAGVERKQKYAFCGAHLMEMAEKSKYKDAAWKFISEIYSTDETWKRVEQLNMPVVRKSLSEKYISSNPMNKGIMDAINIGGGNPKVTFINVAFTYERQAYEEALFGKKPAAQALKDCADNLRKEIKK